jgi:hypothetical protein
LLYTFTAFEWAGLKQRGEAGLFRSSSQLSGLVGSIYNEAINNGFYDKDTADKVDTGKGEPQSTANMKLQGIYMN